MPPSWFYSSNHSIVNAPALPRPWRIFICADFLRIFKAMRQKLHKIRYYLQEKTKNAPPAPLATPSKSHLWAQGGLNLRGFIWQQAKKKKTPRFLLVAKQKTRWQS